MTPLKIYSMHSLMEKLNDYHERRTLTMKKIFLLEYQKKLFSLLFLLSAIILIIIYTTNCLPANWIYYQEPMNQEQLIYQTLKADLMRGETEEMKAFVNNNWVQQSTIYQKIQLTDSSSELIHTILNKMKPEDSIQSYPGFQEDLEQLDQMLGGNSYYKPGSDLDILYHRYFDEATEIAPIANTHELCDEMYSYLKETLENDSYYITYSIDTFQIPKFYSKEERKKIAKIEQAIAETYQNQQNEDTKYETILMYFNEIDDILGNNTIFGEKYRNRYFYQTLSLKDAKEEYQSILSDEKLTNSYARYYTDYMTVFAGLLPVVFGIFCLWYDQRYHMQEIVFSKKISSFQYIFLKFISIAALFFTIYMIIAAVSTGLFARFAQTQKISIDFLAFFKYTIGWIMPTVFITTASSMFLYIIFWNPIPPLMIELILFFLSAKDVYGNYFIWKPIIRYNFVGRYDYFMEHLEEIVKNRIAMVFLSGFLLFLCSVLYERKRRGKRI